jgi:hypothetical protein
LNWNESGLTFNTAPALGGTITINTLQKKKQWSFVRTSAARLFVACGDTSGEDLVVFLFFVF